MSNGYVPIPFPTIVYGPMGEEIYVVSPAVLATLPVTYTAAPVPVVASVVVAAPVTKVPTPTIIVKSVTLPSKKKGND